MKIFVDPGHGGKDVGAIGYNSQGLFEKDLNLDIGLKIRCILIERGYEVMMSRDTDEYISLVDRVNKANNWGADYFISVHCNAAENVLANGIETLYYPTSTNGKNLAQKAQTELIKQTGQTDRGIKPRDLYVLRKTRMPAILPECGFMSNPIENQLLNQEQYRGKCARALCDALE